MRKRNLAIGGALASTILAGVLYFARDTVIEYLYPVPNGAQQTTFTPPGGGDAMTKAEFLKEVKDVMTSLAADVDGKLGEFTPIALQSKEFQVIDLEGRPLLVGVRRDKQLDANNPETYIPFIDLKPQQDYLRKQWDRLPPGERPSRTEVMDVAGTTAREEAAKIHAKVVERTKQSRLGFMMRAGLPSTEQVQENAAQIAHCCAEKILGPELAAEEARQNQAPKLAENQGKAQPQEGKFIGGAEKGGGRGR
jgi:hypothetical protein